MPAELDVLAIGNAIVDVVSTADDAFLSRYKLAKGTMTLIDERTADYLYAAMGPGREVSGGSAANTAVGVASFGGRAGFVGKVREDELGRIFRHDIGASGVAFATPAATDGPSTARCLIFVTPDAQRTMQTYLGACVRLSPADIDRSLVESAELLYLEGYLFDPPQAQQAFREAAEIAQMSGRKVALTLSDPFCVARHRAAFIDLVERFVDVLFANEAEITSLYETADFDTALQSVRKHCPTAALTRSEKGSVIVAGDEVHVIDAAPANVVDTTGAGDLYAAGFLAGFSRGKDLATCARLGSIAAAEIISHFGARPERRLADLAREKA